MSALYTVRISFGYFPQVYIELDYMGPQAGPGCILLIPPPNRGQVQLLNLADQGGLPRGISGFSLAANMHTTPSLRESHLPSVGSKVTGLHEQGRGNTNLSETREPFKRISDIRFCTAKYTSNKFIRYRIQLTEITTEFSPDQTGLLWIS